MGSFSKVVAAVSSVTHAHQPATPCSLMACRDFSKSLLEHLRFVSQTSSLSPSPSQTHTLSPSISPFYLPSQPCYPTPKVTYGCLPFGVPLHGNRQKGKYLPPKQSTDPSLFLRTVPSRPHSSFACHTGQDVHSVTSEKCRSSLVGLVIQTQETCVSASGQGTVTAKTNP